MPSGDLPRQVVVFLVKYKANLLGKALRWLHLTAAPPASPLLLLQQTWYPAWPHPDLSCICAWMWAQLSMPRLLSLALVQLEMAVINVGNSCVTYMEAQPLGLGEYSS